MSEQFSFETALVKLKEGKSVSRLGWNGVAVDLRMSVTLQIPDTMSKMSQPYLFMNVEGSCVPWQPSQLDLLSADWFVTV